MNKDLDIQKKLQIRKKACKILKKAGIKITNDEIKSMEIIDFGLGKPEILGVQIVVYVNNERYCAKELILLPGQTCAEHKHPPRGVNDPGKMETFRCRWGKVHLFTEGKASPSAKTKVPKFRKNYFTVMHEIILKPGEQYTLPPDTLHWFRAGSRGAVVSEFSSTSTDETDIFTDPEIVRKTETK